MLPSLRTRQTPLRSSPFASTTSPATQAQRGRAFVVVAEREHEAAAVAELRVGGTVGVAAFEHVAVANQGGVLHDGHEQATGQRGHPVTRPGAAIGDHHQQKRQQPQQLDGFLGHEGKPGRCSLGVAPGCPPMAPAGSTLCGARAFIARRPCSFGSLCAMSARFAAARAVRTGRLGAARARGVGSRTRCRMAHGTEPMRRSCRHRESFTPSAVQRPASGGLRPVSPADAGCPGGAALGRTLASDPGWNLLRSAVRSPQST